MQFYPENTYPEKTQCSFVQRWMYEKEKKIMKVEKICFFFFFQKQTKNKAQRKVNFSGRVSVLRCVKFRLWDPLYLSITTDTPPPYPPIL